MATADSNDGECSLTNNVLLNVCSFFEILYEIDPTLFSWKPVSPQDWIDLCQSSSMPPNLNFTVFQLLQMCGIQSRSPNLPEYLPNPQLEELLFNEIQIRESQFILHCPINDTFTQCFRSTHTESDAVNGVTNENNDNSNALNEHEHDEEEADEMNEYGIPWDRVEYEQLPILYKVEHVPK